MYTILKKIGISNYYSYRLMYFNWIMTHWCKISRNLLKEALGGWDIHQRKTIHKGLNGLYLLKQVIQ